MPRHQMGISPDLRLKSACAQTNAWLPCHYEGTGGGSTVSLTLYGCKQLLILLTNDEIVAQTCRTAKKIFNMTNSRQVPVLEFSWDK